MDVIRRHASIVKSIDIDATSDDDLLSKVEALHVRDPFTCRTNKSLAPDLSSIVTQMSSLQSIM